MRDPVVDLAQRTAVQAVQPLPSRFACFDQPGFAQDPQVMRNGRLSDIKAVYQFAYRELAASQ